MKKGNVSVSNPEELNKHLQHTNPFTWIALGIVTFLLIIFFLWSYFFKMIKEIKGVASIEDGVASLVVSDRDLGKLEKGQKVIIDKQEGEILSFDDNRNPIVSKFSLEDGEYTYTVEVVIRPIYFVIGKNV